MNMNPWRSYWISFPCDDPRRTLGETRGSHLSIQVKAEKLVLEVLHKSSGESKSRKHAVFSR